MAYVKLDTGILDSTLWIERECREVFITALLMASPREFKEPLQQIAVRKLALTGFEAPAGWYGFVEAAGPGIVRRAMVEQDAGLAALEKLGSPDLESRSKAHDGRRLIRIDGGYAVLNFIDYRDRDHTAGLRAQRYRDRKRAEQSSHRDLITSHRNVTQAEAEAEKRISAAPQSTASPKFDVFWAQYPKKVGKDAARRAFAKRKVDGALLHRMLQAINAQTHSEMWRRDAGQYIPNPATWLNEGRWQDEGVALPAPPASKPSTFLAEQAAHLAQVKAEREARKQRQA